ncbi:MAG: DivIVA domain-containing protein [Gemmatimonadota bacterium]|nr:DivIVA domain-containing protein [Gemmatimonadota bacterium]
MIDDSFRLTPVDVRNMDFGRALRGYDPVRVEDFRDKVASELESVIRLNQELETKGKGLVEQLRAYRERDKALNEALVAAQQLRSEIREQAEREAQLMLREARAEGDRLLDAARSEIRKVEVDLQALERTRRAFVGQLRALVDRHLQELDAIEAVTPSRVTEPAEQEQPPRPASKTPAWLNSLVQE